MLDKYICGSVHRISPEAPVPIVDMEEVLYYPGGAANVATNIQSIANATLIGLIGGDAEGKILYDCIKKRGITLPPPLRGNYSVQTTTKTRIIAGGQQLLRIDTEPLKHYPLSLIHI